jgi:23S rRNA pseudouridine1911/1915/1917 synthase
MVCDILYEDNHIIAVYKPAGMLVQGDHSGDPTLMDEVKYFLKQKYNKPGNVFLGMVHRLDRPVSGIVIFGKTSKGASRLSEQIRNHSIQKIYHALVIGIPKEPRGTLVNYLKKDTDKNFVRVYDTPVDGALRAELDYEVVRSKNGKSLIKIKLKTGRSHQIRTQLSHIACPIVGDVKYGAPTQIEVETNGEKHTVLALCATSLTFKLATVDEVKHIEISIPQEWNF